MNRRDFLRSTAAAGAAVVAAPLVALPAKATRPYLVDVYPVCVLGKTHFGGTTPLSGDAIFGTGMPTILREQQLEYDADMHRTLAYYSRTFQIPNGT